MDNPVKCIDVYMCKIVHCICRLSNHLQIFSKYCALSWKDVHAVAADILDTVKTQASFESFLGI